MEISEKKLNQIFAAAVHLERVAKCKMKADTLLSLATARLISELSILDKKRYQDMYNEQEQKVLDAIEKLPKVADAPAIK